MQKHNQKAGIFIILSIIAGLTATSAQAGEPSRAAEPAYCNPATFKNYEVKYTGPNPVRFHSYKIGKLILAGMGVGQSKAQDVANVALSADPTTKSEHYCTWYFNDGNTEAQKAFRWIDLPKPSGSNTTAMTKSWLGLLAKEFSETPTSFVSCAVKHGYIGQGCNGMKHRGPSVHAMILAYAGCSPQNATKIANQVWGENGIGVPMREALAKAASDLAAQNLEASNALKAVMTNP